MLAYLVLSGVVVSVMREQMYLVPAHLRNGHFVVFGDSLLAIEHWALMQQYPHPTHFLVSISPPN